MTLTLHRTLFAFLLVLAFLAGTTWGSAQFVSAQPVEPKVLSGSDIGFRMTARKGDTPVGQIVVRVDGQWKEVEYSFGLKPITERK
jgi:hypothetical protein